MFCQTMSRQLACCPDSLLSFGLSTIDAAANAFASAIMVCPIIASAIMVSPISLSLSVHVVEGYLDHDSAAVIMVCPFYLSLCQFM